ncbi:2-succinyl-6-hydroxy-2,4-cyclohexadiene-1-carboxylate synthase [Enterobacter sp. ENT03]|uniref:2-succinyl-6-hydroxy-2, 4-cyclohexadiene-1-carboxylate synthase n=1 Tax=Enterobacter sp. ENT03 TaxID=2854780 RepID=UPI001C43AD1D|nr:2-succinyl-6-hydroxy-2,4-cyclohexadiene-1-carboxylate synthase [Enterobacter sp. ENT03]MBV7406216.1 2-succinyl-6-hydroxy-2,4-cyclohexadiene-1-carboxylate synthase [Enterobacter sp. ENT03]
MILHARAETANPDQPWLVFLHGFSGDHREWQPVGEHFRDYSRLYVDLPGHGGSAEIPATDFAQVSVLLSNTLHSYNILSYWLIGYSLGGRLGMYHACAQPQGLAGLIVEGAHPGLTDAEARRQRAENDARWAARFHDEPLEAVFRDWYQQPVFASLNADARRALVTLREHNNGAALAAMLNATSLSRQPDLRAALHARTFPFYYLCGEHDAKFRAIGDELAAPCLLIAAAGHNAHRENPAAVADRLAHILRLH